MPRPIVNQSGQTSTVPRLPIEYPMVTVDAPDAYYGAARVQIHDMTTIVVLNREFHEIGRYNLAEPPSFQAGGFVAEADGAPLVVTRVHDCGCGTKTTKELKDGSR